MPHLSYVGDADVGAGSNLGASTITANYDGRDKHRTTIGEGVSTMVHSTLVAPVTIGDGAYVAAGQRDHRGCRAGRARDRAPAPDDQARICRAGRRAPEGGGAVTPTACSAPASSFPRATGATAPSERAAQQLARRHLVPAR